MVERCTLHACYRDNSRHTQHTYMTYLQSSSLYALPVVVALGFGVAFAMPTDYEQAMREQIRIAEDASRLGRRLSCVRIGRLLRDCMESDGGEVCNTLRTAEEEHLHFFPPYETSAGLTPRDHAYTDCIRPELGKEDSDIPGEAHQVHEKEPLFQ